METTKLIADRAALEAIVHEHVPHIEQITYIDHGHDNLVVIVNETLVFRFPRNDRAARRLTFEIALLQYIEGKISVLPTPKIIEVSTDPLYVVTSYYPGEHLHQDQIEALSSQEQQAIGIKLAEFIYQFSNAIPGEHMQQLRKQAGLIGMEETWPEYFTRLFVIDPLPNAKLGPIVKHYYDIWKNYVVAEQGGFSIHDDLHPANILFSGASISAVLDFGDANTGTAEEEMRGLYRMGEEVMRATIARYKELSGRDISYDHIRIWSIMNDLARFVRYLSEDRTTHPAFLRAQTNLRQWVPDFPL